MAEQKKDPAPSVSVDALKSAFKEGATPNEKDYGALIDLAAVGSKALGAKDATPTTLEPGAGLKMDKDKLTVSAGNGVTVNDQGVAVKGDGKSVTVTDKGVGVQVKPDGGLTTDGEKGLHVKLGAGVTSTADGLAIHLADNSGLKAEKTGLAVNVATGLEFDKQGALTVKVKTGEVNYITSDKDGLAITKEGVKAIENALKSVSLEALKKADDATSHGFKVDATPDGPNEGVQKQIAEKLNGAFTEGWHLRQPREALFTALKAFRTTNKAKIYKEGLIAPSAVTGKAGLYNQEGVEYVAGTVIAYKVSPSGEAQEVKTGAYTDEDGIYALVGKLGPDGVPKAGDTFEKVTPHALMVLVAQKVVTVVGHWDFTGVRWAYADADGGWLPGPTADGVAGSLAKKRAAEDSKKAAEDKLSTGERRYKEGFWTGVKTATGASEVKLLGGAWAAKVSMNGSAGVLSAHRPGFYRPQSVVGRRSGSSTYIFEISGKFSVEVGGLACTYEPYHKVFGRDKASDVVDIDFCLVTEVEFTADTEGYKISVTATLLRPLEHGEDPKSLPALPATRTEELRFFNVTAYKGRVFLPNSLGSLDLEITI